MSGVCEDKPEELLDMQQELVRCPCDGVDDRIVQIPTYPAPFSASHAFRLR